MKLKKFQNEEPLESKDVQGKIMEEEKIKLLQFIKYFNEKNEYVIQLFSQDCCFEISDQNKTAFDSLQFLGNNYNLLEINLQENKV